MRVTRCLSVGLVLCLMAVSSTASTNAVRSVSVTGRAIGYVPVDVAVWTLVMRTTDRDLSRTREKSEEQVRNLTAQLLRHKGVTTADIDAGLIRVGNSEAGGSLTMTRTLIVRQRDLGGFSGLLDALGGVGGLEVHYTFESSRRAEIVKATVCKAVEAARIKAAAMAEVAGARLGRVTELSEYPPPHWSTPDQNVIVDVPMRALATESEKTDVMVFATFELQ